MKKLFLFLNIILLMKMGWASQPSPHVEKNINNHTAQSKEWWLNLGIGGGGSVKSKYDRDDSAGGALALITSGNYRLSEHQLLSARILNTNLDLFNKSNFTDVGLMYGVIAKSQYGYISGSVGLGVVNYEQWEDLFFSPPRHIKTASNVGIPTEIQLFFTPFRYVGIGIIGFANVNPIKNIAGAALALQIGNLRQE